MSGNVNLGRYICFIMLALLLIHFVLWVNVEVATFHGRSAQKTKTGKAGVALLKIT